MIRHLARGDPPALVVLMTGDSKGKEADRWPP